MTRRLAPTLEALMRAEWNFMDLAGPDLVGGEYARAETAAWRSASAELRALLAVAREMDLLLPFVVGSLAGYAMALGHEYEDPEPVKRAYRVSDRLARLSAPREKKRPARVRGGEGDAE